MDSTVVKTEIIYHIPYKAGDRVKINKVDRSFLGNLATNYFKKFTGKIGVISCIKHNKQFPLLVIPDGYKGGLFLTVAEVEKL